MLMILNASYSPNLNPIEGVIGIGKNMIKHQRWHNLQVNEQMEDEVLINGAFKKVKLS